MSESQNPLQGENWIVEPGSPEYYASRKRGNIFILLALLAFVAFTIGVVAWKFDVGEFMQITQEHEAEQQRLEALREQYEASLSREQAQASDDS